MDTTGMTIEGMANTELSEVQKNRARSLIKQLPDDFLMNEGEARKSANLDAPDYMTGKDLTAKYSPQGNIITLESKTGRDEEIAVASVPNSSKNVVTSKEHVHFTYNGQRYGIWFR